MPPIADAGADKNYNYGDLPVAQVQLSGSGSGGVGPYTYQWSIVDQPDGASATLDFPNTQNPKLLNVTVIGTYLVFLTVTDSVPEASESDFVKAPESARVHVNVADSIGQVIPAKYERFWQDKVKLLFLWTAQLKSLLTTHTHPGSDIDPAEVGTLGVVELAEAPLVAANPKAVTQSRTPVSFSVAGQILVSAATPQSQALVAQILPESVSLHTISAVLKDSGATGNTSIEIYDMTLAQFAANNWGAATLLTTVILPASARAPTVNNSMLGSPPTLVASHVLAARVIAPTPTTPAEDLFLTFGLRRRY